MANLLIVAEKPSCGKTIAEAANIKEQAKHRGYIEGYSGFFGCTVWITWCVGHLVQMCPPEVYDTKYRRWSMEDLPVLPSKFKYEIIPALNEQFQIVAGLMNSDLLIKVKG